MDEDKYNLATKEMTQKWLITFDQHDQIGLIGFVNNTEKLPEIIDIIRRTGGKNIVIADQNPFFYDKPED